MEVTTLFALIVTGLSVTVNAVPLAFTVTASELPNWFDDSGVADVYMNIYYRERFPDKYIFIGRSETIHNTTDPTWEETFTFEYTGKEGYQQILLEIFDEDEGQDSDDFMGLVYFTLETLQGQCNTLEQRLYACSADKRCGKFFMTKTNPCIQETE